MAEVASSLAGLDYNAFAPHTTAYPSPMDYFSMGQQAVQSVLDEQFKAQTRQQLLDQQGQNLAMQRLLGPSKIAAADWQAAGYQRPTYNPAPISGGPGDSRGILGSTFPIASISTPPGNATDLPSDSSSPSAGSLFGTQTVRQTTYAPGETNSDPDTDAGRTATGGPLVEYKPGMAGTASVDPSLIPYGSIIKRADGSTYVAADTGGAVVSKAASQGKVPVIDFNDTNGNVPDYGAVKILPPTADYLKLSPAEKLVYHANAASVPNGSNATGSSNDAPATFPLQGDMGITGGNNPLFAPLRSPLLAQAAATNQSDSPDSSLLGLGPSLADPSTPLSSSTGGLFGSLQTTPAAAPDARFLPMGTSIGGGLGILASASLRSPSASLAASSPSVANLVPTGSGIGAGASNGIRSTVSPFTPGASVAAPSSVAAPLASTSIGGPMGIASQPYKLVTGFTDPNSHQFVAVSDPRQVPAGLNFESRPVPAAASIPIRDDSGAVIGYNVNNRFVRASTVDQRSDAKVAEDLAKAGGNPRQFTDGQGRFDRMGALSQLGQLSQDDGPTGPRPTTDYQQASLALRQAREARLTAGSGAPQLDSPRKFSADLQAQYGHGLSEFQNAGPEDTRPENGGLAFYLGGEDGAPKERVFLPAPQATIFKQRLQGIQTGQPAQLNPNYQQGAKASAGSTQDDAAAAWAAANPTDPRAAQIKQRLGIQ